MKKLTIFTRVAVTVIAVFSLSSCEKNFLDVNDNPNLPKDVPVNIILPTGQASLAYTLGGDIARYNAIFTQNVTGVGRQFIGYNSYIFTEEDFNNLWNNMYADNMEDFAKIMEKASASPGNYDAYRGVAKVMMAYSLMTMTDLFGNVPYTSAFKGNDKIAPPYDTQQDIYTTILPGLLNSAIVDMGNSSDDFFVPGSDDMIYGGDLAKWAMLANGLKARMSIHLTKRGSAAAAQAAMDAITAGGLTSNADDAFMAFPGGTNQNPWYQYIDQRADISYSPIDAYYGVSNTLVDALIANNDPRYNAMIDINGDIYDVGFPSGFYMAETAPVYFYSYYEQKFIEAEAKLILGDDAGAETALHEAISANMEKLGVAPADDAIYQAANVIWATAPDKMALILTQKYYANYLQPESFNDWRRTGFPALTPNAGATSPIPRRLIYPTNERLYNGNADNAASTMQNPKLYWDN